MTAKEWIQAYADRLGTEAPTAEELAILLDLAREAAHASERIAAPVACWLTARAGCSPAAALKIASELAMAPTRSTGAPPRPAPPEC